jgi:hypothetical protein
VLALAVVSTRCGEIAALPMDDVDFTPGAQRYATRPA